MPISPTLMRSFAPMTRDAEKARAAPWKNVRRETLLISAILDPMWFSCKMGLAAVAAVALAGCLRAAPPLTIYVIDESPVDASAALVVAPSGESMLIDAGF